MKLKNSRRFRTVPSPKPGGRSVHRPALLLRPCERPTLAPQSLLSTDEFAALIAVAAGQDPALTWAH